MNLSPALAQAAAPPTQPNPTGEMVRLVGMMVAFGVMIYFVMIRPQQKRAKQQAELLKAMKPGDKVVTNSGIFGTVISVKDKTVTLRSADSKLEIAKVAVTEITERSGESSSES
ncbi:MAG: preprotein translocase subunit YajC [Verrucomicrobiota bacterium]